MVNIDDQQNRIKNMSPQARAIFNVVNKQFKESGCSKGVTVITSDEMTDEESEMALFEGFLKEGYTEEAATQKAKEWLSMCKL